MSTATVSRTAATTTSSSTSAPPTARTSPGRRVLGVVVRPQSYRNIAYLLLGLPLGTAWFSVLVTGVAVGASLVTAALLGIPVLLAMWYVTRACANVERATATTLLDAHVPLAPLAPPGKGNVWVRLRSLTSEHARWREVGFLLARFPAGIATFTIAVTALTTPVVVALAPFTARSGGEHPFGTWTQSWRIEDVAGSPWAWLLIPLGAALMVAAFHALNGLARACARWTAASLRLEDGPAAR
jgi:hypothetical protein